VEGEEETGQETGEQARMADGKGTRTVFALCISGWISGREHSRKISLYCLYKQHHTPP